MAMIEMAMIEINTHIGKFLCIKEKKSDSSSLTNEKDHHYFLNSADVCW